MDRIRVIRVTSVRGVPGLSAYELAVRDGFDGTESQWIASLEGPQGPPGQSGTGGGNSYFPAGW